MDRSHQRMPSAVRALFLLGCVLCGPVEAQNCPAAIVGESRADVVANPAGYDYDVYFTTDATADQFTAASAGFVRDSLPNSHNTLVDATRNFDPPFFSEDPVDTCISNSSNTATAPEWGFTVDTASMNGQPEPFIRFVMGHEMFHHVEYAYIDFDEWPSWGAWTVEGFARAMEEKMWLDTDINAGNSFFVGEVANYMANPNQTLMDISYTSAPFWAYLSEQLGTPFPEPARGVDVFQRFWTNTAGNDPDSVQYLRETISSFDEDATLEDMFIDFAVTNYTHDLDVSALPEPDRWQYFDETVAGGGGGPDGVLGTGDDSTYDSVARDAVLSFNTPIADSVVRWGVRYFEVDVPADQGCEAIGFWAKAQDGASLGWALIGIKDGHRVTELYRATGNEFYRALINPVTDQYQKLALVVVGLNNAADFDYAFGFGPVTGEIRLPTLDRMAFVGTKSDPERFQVRLLMEGPDVLTPDGSGDISLRGLDPTLFDVTLRSVATGALYDAEILNASYVSGEYWMAVQAPVITNAADGDLYDLQICFCKRSGSCTQVLLSAKSVLYADITLNQMLVVDRSYSMHYPTADPKIDAAKNAARIYVNAAADDDRLGLATFSGNNAECNDDAVTDFALADVAPNRAALITDIDAIVEDGWTSIGDGIKHGRDALFAAGGAADVRSIVLMSDGLENEGDFWGKSNGACGAAPVRDSFDPALGGPASDMRIDTIAFGSDADQALLQDIAVFTNGDFYAVSTDAPPMTAAFAAGLDGAGISAAPSASLEVPNRLASVYRSIEEASRELDRLYSKQTTLPAGGSTTLMVPVTEKQGGGIRDAVFAINWHVPGGGVLVELRDPNGTLINPGAPGWQVLSNTTNKVYRYSGTLATGTWQIRVSAGAEEQILAMLSGRIVHGVDLNAYLSSTPTLAPTRCERTVPHMHMRGMPVGVLANLNDSKGGILSAEVEATVENPDGSVNVLALFDDGHHDDGVGGDGIYGNRYTRTPFYSTNGVPDFPDGPPHGPWGSYSVTIAANGVSNYGETFERTQLRAFQVYEFGPQDNCDPDLDRDGLPDRWESYYGLDSSNPADVSDDNDNDGLKNEEEFKFGTLPFDPDTDDGGEADGSEVFGGRDPLYQRDDLLPAIVDYGVVTQRIDLPVHEPKSNTNILHFPVNPAYEAMQIWRTDPSWSGFRLVKTVDFSTSRSGVHYDGGLANGTFFYQYYLVAEGLSGAQTAPTDIFGAMPKSDPLPPKGWIRINDGLAETPSPNVVLTLDTSDDSKEVLISQNADFAGAAWQPIQAELPFVLAPGPAPYVARVHVKFRDAAKNESVIYHDSIVVDPNADNDEDGRIDTMDNCTLVANADQRDTNGDGYGNLCDPDLNGDLIVNFTDIGEFKNVFFTADPHADLDGDGTVNFLDIGIAKAMFFSPPGPSGIAP